MAEDLEKEIAVAEKKTEAMLKELEKIEKKPEATKYFEKPVSDPEEKKKPIVCFTVTPEESEKYGLEPESQILKNPRFKELRERIKEKE